MASGPWLSRTGNAGRPREARRTRDWRARRSGRADTALESPEHFGVVSPYPRRPVTLSVRIESSDSNALVKLAEAGGVGFSEYVRAALVAHVRRGGGRGNPPTRPSRVGK